jgi:hypothetical protein
MYTYLQKYTTYVCIYQNIHHKWHPRHQQRIAGAPVADKDIAHVGVSPTGFLKF